MQPAIKFCGLTRPEDAEEAVALGADYLGVIFAPSRRRCTVGQAQRIFAVVPQPLEAADARGALAPADRGAPLGRMAASSRTSPRRVGVFAGHSSSEIAAIAQAVPLDVIQLHEAWEPAAIAALRDATHCRIWSVVGVGRDGVMPEASAVAGASDGVLLDTKIEGALGGTGESFDWHAVRANAAILRSSGPVILAGGLHPMNVALAIATLRPDVVDVSSGVESSPGIKDHARMRAFADAVRGVAQE